MASLTESGLHARFRQERVLPRLRALLELAARDGLGALPSDDLLVRIGMEIAPDGRVVKNSYGHFEMAWQRRRHARWARQVAAEAAEIRSGIAAAHGAPPRFLIWAGMGGSAEDKTAYLGAGLLGGPFRCYVLDSTDPAKLAAILADITRRSRGSLARALRATVVAGMAMGVTSYEPVVNLTKLWNVYEAEGVDGRANFVYMTLPGSLLDRFASSRGFRHVPLQLDGGNSTAGRHSSPLTRGSLYPLAFAGADLEAWIAGTQLTAAEIDAAFRLTAFLEAHGRTGRDKVTLRLCRSLAPAGLWTKQNFEESLGKSEEIGIKIVIGEAASKAFYRPAEDPKQDRVFVSIGVEGEKLPEAPAGYPAFRHQLPEGAPLSRYMQFVHYAVFGLGYLREMNFITQPNVELYKQITAELFQTAKRKGGVQATPQWKKLEASGLEAGGGLTLFCTGRGPRVAAERLAALVASEIEYGDLAFYGDTRESAGGRAMGSALESAATMLFRERRMPADVYEGPAMNHSYHEMVIGHGRALSIIVFSRKQASLAIADYDAEYHLAQILSTKLALEQRGRRVCAIAVPDLTESSRASLLALFRSASAVLAARPAGV